ncbi:MAG: signal peptidase II [Brevundimonas sp.]|jgi:signal peptidase II|uniref:signal peptidase II n=1 Tax=Brevundimonas sp. TaxID=1871086 RepID=UPI0039E5B423
MPDRKSALAPLIASKDDIRSIRLASVALALAAVGIDQLTKAWARTLTAAIEVAPFLNLDLSFNRGVTFGLLSADSDMGRWLLVALTGAVAATVLVAAWRTRRLPLALALGAVAGGAVGNIIDRVRQGAVTDFIDFYVGAWRWPTFNLADAAIVCGVAVLFWLTARSGQSAV